MVDQDTSQMSDGFYEQQTAPQAPEVKAKRKLHPNAKRNMVLVGGLFVAALVITVVIVGQEPDATQSGPQSALPPPNTNQQRDVELSDTYRNLVEDQNKQSLTDTQNQGGSFLPVVITPPKKEEPNAAAFNVETNRNFSQMNDSLTVISSQTVGEDQTVYVDMAQRERDLQAVQARAQAVSQQMVALINKSQAQAGLTIMAPKSERIDQSAGGSMNGAMSGQPGRSGQNTGINAMFLNADDRGRPGQGAIQTAANGNMPLGGQSATGRLEPPDYTNNLLKPAMVTMDKPLTVNRDGLALATVRSGAYEGAKLQGQAQKNGQEMSVVFNTMVYQGNVYPITAIGLDENTASAIVEGDYKGYYFDRYVVPFLFGLGEVYAEAAGTPREVVVVDRNGNNSEVTQQPTNRQAIFQGISAGLKSIQKAFSENTLEPEVRTQVNQPMIVIWLARQSQ